MTTTIAVDVGSGYTKFCIADGRKTPLRGSIPSIVADVGDRQRVESGFGVSSPYLIEIDGHTFIVGEDARMLVEKGQRRPTLSNDYALSDQWLALLLVAICELVNEAESSVNVCVALPQAIYQSSPEMRDRLTKRLNDSFSFRLRGMPRTLKLHAVVAPQAAAVVLDCANRESGLSEDGVEIGVVDIGTFTTGFGVFMNSRMFVQRCSGVEAGISGIIDELGERIRKDYGASLDTPSLHEIIRHGSFRYRGKVQDASQMIFESSARTARTIITELRKVWPSADTMDVFIAGGGAPVLASAIRNEIPHAKVSEEPFWAVVGGLGVYAVQAFKSSGTR